MRPAPHPDGPPPSPQQAHFDFADLSEELLLRLEQEQYEREQLKSDIDFWDDDRIHVLDPQTLARPLRLSGEEATTLLVALRMLAQLPGVEDRQAVLTAAAKLEQAAGGAAAKGAGAAGSAAGGASKVGAAAGAPPVGASGGGDAPSAPIGRALAGGIKSVGKALGITDGKSAVKATLSSAIAGAPGLAWHAVRSNRRRQNET